MEEKTTETVKNTEGSAVFTENKTTFTESGNNLQQDLKKKNISFIKSKAFIIFLAIAIYTIIVVSVTVKIDRVIIADQIQKSFQDTFSFEADSESESEYEKSETESEEPKDENKISNKEKESSKKNVRVEIDQTLMQEDVYEATIIGYDFGKKIMPPNPPSFYTYYEAKEEGHQYLDLKLNYKNLEATGVSADTVASAKLKFNGKYEYTSFSAIEDGEGDFTYSNITDISPLTTGKMHYLFEIPDEVANSTESLVATITIKGNSYEFVIR